MRATAAAALLLVVAAVPACKDEEPSGPAPVAVAPAEPQPVGHIQVILRVPERQEQAREVVRQRLAELDELGRVPIHSVEIRTHGSRELVIDVRLAGELCDGNRLPEYKELVKRTVSRSGALAFRRANDELAETVADGLRQANPLGGATIQASMGAAEVTGAPREAVVAAVADGLDLPGGHVALVERARPVEQRSKEPSPIIVRAISAKDELTGAEIADARLDFDAVRNSPQVAVVLTESGKETFAELTRGMVDKRLAVVFEGELIMAPVVREEIAGGRAVISLGAIGQQAAEKEAQEVAAILRAGALPPGASVLSHGAVCE